MQLNILGRVKVKTKRFSFFCFTRTTQIFKLPTAFSRCMDGDNVAGVQGFFQNKELNIFYISVGIMTFAEQLIALFVPIYLFRLQYPLWMILFYFFLLSVYFVVLAYPGAKLVSKMGMKRSILMSTPFAILYYIGLLALPQQQWLFAILPVFLASKMVLYNYGYHLNFLRHSIPSQRGKEVSFLGSIATIGAVIAPLLGGVIISLLGFMGLYSVGAVLLVGGAVLLFLTSDVRKNVTFSWKELVHTLFSSSERRNAVSFSGYAVESIISRVVWPLFLITILLTEKKTGLVVTLSLGVSLLVYYVIGKITDAYSKPRLIAVGTILHFFAWLGRIFATSTGKILVVDSYKNVVEKLLHVPWATQSYNLARRRGYFRFVVGREIMFNFSRIIVLPFVILLFWWLSDAFIITFIIAAVFSLGYMFLEKK